MKLLNQPLDGCLGDYLLKLINSRKYKTLNIIVAFAKNSGVLKIKEALQNFRSQGGKVNVIVGVDMTVTSYEALFNLLSITDALNVVHVENSITFHSKIYHFIGKEEHTFIIGSNNLTTGGLWTNFESTVIVDVNTENKT